MAMFVSILLTCGFAFWFFQTSEKLGSKSAQWAIAGAIAYQVPAWAWMLLVSKPYLTALRSTAAKTTFSATLIGHSWIVVGIVAALLVYKFALLKTNVKAEQA
jgi:hypothetical protein